MDTTSEKEKRSFWVHRYFSNQRQEDSRYTNYDLIKQITEAQQDLFLGGRKDVDNGGERATGVGVEKTTIRLGAEHKRHFDGETYEPTRDQDRLNSLMERVYFLMRGGEWRTLAEIRDLCGGSEASVSARLRDFRKEKFGKYVVERRRLSGGLWQYRLLV